MSHNMIVQKDQALKLMQQGIKITHDYFTSEEWMTIKKGKLVFEDGYTCTIEEFYKDRNGKGWETGYYLFKED